MAPRITHTVTLTDQKTGDTIPGQAVAYAANSARQKGLDLLRTLARAEGQTYSRVAPSHYIWAGDKSGRVLTITVTT